MIVTIAAWIIVICVGVPFVACILIAILQSIAAPGYVSPAPKPAPMTWRKAGRAVLVWLRDAALWFACVVLPFVGAMWATDHFQGDYAALIGSGFAVAPLVVGALFMILTQRKGTQ